MEIHLGMHKENNDFQMNAWYKTTTSSNLSELSFKEEREKEREREEII